MSSIKLKPKGKKINKIDLGPYPETGQIFIKVLFGFWSYGPL